MGVNVAGYFTSEKGVGEAGRASIRALEAAGIPFVLNNFVDVGSANKEVTDQGFSDTNPYGINLVHVNADQVPRFVARQGKTYLRGRTNIGFWFWELAQFPDQWQPSFTYLDEVWVASNFTLDAVSRVSPIPVVKMPLGLRPELPIATHVTRADFGLPAESFVFLFMFDFQSSLQRKNPTALIEAFKMAFDKRDDVVLALKGTRSRDVVLGLKVADLDPGAKNIRVIDQVLPREQVNALLNVCDCYASLHRSEGFGLTIAEAMILGKPVIVTSYSGNMDFTTTANSLLVKYRMVEIAKDHGPYKKGCVWADPDVVHAAELMRYVYENRETAREIGRRGQEDIRRLYHPDTAGQSMKHRLIRLAARGCRNRSALVSGDSGPRADRCDEPVTLLYGDSDQFEYYFHLGRFQVGAGRTLESKASLGEASRSLFILRERLESHGHDLVTTRFWYHSLIEHYSNLGKIQAKAGCMTEARTSLREAIRLSLRHRTNAKMFVRSVLRLVRSYLTV